MATAHGHSHGGGHFHAVSPEADRAKLRLALALILGFMCVEVVAGILASSLALLSDAAHMLTDAGGDRLRAGRDAACGTAARGRLHLRPQAGRDPRRAAERGDAGSCSGVWIVYEGIGRLARPPETEGAAVLVVAVAGIARQPGGDEDPRRAPTASSLNVEGAYQHILTDLVAFVATAVAGAVILLTGFDRADGDRGAVRRRDHVPLRLRAAARLGPDPARGGAAGPRPRRDRPRDGGPSPRSRTSTTCTSGR